MKNNNFWIAFWANIIIAQIITNSIYEKDFWVLFHLAVAAFCLIVDFIINIKKDD